MIRVTDISGTPLIILKNTRDYLLSCRENVSEEVRIGLNYNIIIGTALILEAESESLIHNIINQYEELCIKYYQLDLIGCDANLAANARCLLNSSFSKLKEYSSKGTGMEHYKKTFQMLLPKSDLTPLTPYEEGIQVLYQFRNVIAHGRAIRFEERTYYSHIDYEKETKKEIDFMGGYKKAQEYLIKKGLLNVPITESYDFKSLFSNEICDHLIEVESNYYKTLEKCVPFTMKDFRDDFEYI